mgnify:CR=1 FL=1
MLPRKLVPADRARCTHPETLRRLTARRTFFDLVERRELPADLIQGIERYKFRGSSGKVNLALDGLPDFRSLPGNGPHLRGAISI